MTLSNTFLEKYIFVLSFISIVEYKCYVSLRYEYAVIWKWEYVGCWMANGAVIYHAWFVLCVWTAYGGVANNVLLQDSYTTEQYIVGGECIITFCHLFPIFQVYIVVQCSSGHVIWIVFFHTISVARSERAGQLTAGGVVSGWRWWVRSPLGPRWFIGSYVGLYAFSCTRASKLIQQICIARYRSKFKINTHRWWEWHMRIPDAWSVVQCSLGRVIGIVF